ncbi:MAG TPA: putative DNA-binding protein [Virgibacillus sp.]|nr:putative DNA-binding protein [Virgibacillus sp.]
MLEKTMRLNYLFDFYQTLLTPKQREYMKLYYLEDYSLVEISEYASVSRQAVYDNLKRTEAILESYEEKLRLYEKFDQRIQLLKELERMMTDDNSHQKLLLISQLKELS